MIINESNQLIYEYESLGLTIHFKNGDLLAEATDILVVPANPDLQFIGELMANLCEEKV